MTQFAIVRGNLVSGFHVIGGFATEEEAFNYATENRTTLGTEIRLAPIVDVSELNTPTREELQDKLLFEAARPGELVDVSTGLSIDTQDHSEETTDNAAEPSDSVDRGEAAGDSLGGSADGAAVSGVHSPGSSVSGTGDVAGDDPDLFGAGSGGGAEGDLTGGSSND